MSDILQYTFFQNALFAVILIGLAGGIIGTYIVTRRMVFITGGITHASFGGLGLGFFLGISPTLSALFFAVLSALGVEWMSRRNGVRSVLGIRDGYRYHLHLYDTGIYTGIKRISFRQYSDHNPCRFNSVFTIYSRINSRIHTILPTYRIYGFRPGFCGNPSASRTSDRIRHDIFGIGLRSSHNPFSRHHAVNVPTHCTANDIRSVL